MNIYIHYTDMIKIKELFKKFIDNLILRNREFIENYYDTITKYSIFVFIGTAFIGCLVDYPITMFIILLIEILVVFGLIQFSDYIDEILD